MKELPEPEPIVRSSEIDGKPPLGPIKSLKAFRAASSDIVGGQVSKNSFAQQLLDESEILRDVEAIQREEEEAVLKD